MASPQRQRFSAGGDPLRAHWPCPETFLVHRWAGALPNITQCLGGGAPSDRPERPQCQAGRVQGGAGEWAQRPLATSRSGAVLTEAFQLLRVMCDACLL